MAECNKSKPFFNLEALAQDAVGQNLIPADIFVSADTESDQH